MTVALIGLGLVAVLYGTVLYLQVKENRNAPRIPTQEDMKEMNDRILALEATAVTIMTRRNATPDMNGSRPV